MAAEKLQEYIDSVEQLQQAHSRVQKLSKPIGEVFRYLSLYPYKMTVSNANVNFVVTAEREYALNSDEWPSAKQLAEVLSDYINKRVRMQHLYESLSGTQRQSVKPPPEI